MSWAALSDEPWPGAARLAPEASKATFISEATAAGRLLIDLDAPRAAVRGRLGLFIEGAIERALDARGAPPSGTAIRCDRQAALDDQLRRARISGAPGIALWFASLESIANATLTLDAEDSGVLRWWIAASTQYPIAMAFEAGNERLGVYLEPETLGSILARAVSARTDDDSSESASDAPDHASSSFVSTEDFGATDDDTADHTMENDATDDDVTDEEREPGSRLAESARAMAAELGDDGETGWLRDALMELSTPPPPPARATVVERNESRPSIVMSTEPRPATSSFDERLPPPPASPRLELRFAEPAVSLEPARIHVEAPPEEMDSDTRRKLESYARELDAAIGPKPLTVVERLFTNSYVPLRRALDRGADLPGPRETADEWARAFERSYTDGFDALRVRTKRPPMVVDVPDLALRVSRLHGARATQLLLVDSMRYDMGDAVNDRIRALVGQRAACAERFLLWAALPTITGTQIELIGRGPAGLREMSDSVNEDLVVARGRKASMIRRLKAGHREVLKLDVVAARLAEPGGALPSGFDAIADEVAQRVAGHFEGLQPRTMVMVFGDHGFTVESRSDGAATVREGGATPEEVLVPAFAWLVGAVH